MRRLLIDLLCCPECAAFPLELGVIEEGPTTATVGSRSCELVCGQAGGEPPPGGCGACLSTQIVEGFLFCPECERFYFIHQGIARLLGDDLRELIDWTVADRFPGAFDGHREALARFRSGVDHRSEIGAWNLEDVEFWEDEVYGVEEKTAEILRSVARSRPDAGHRAYERERTLFSHVREALGGGTLLDVGCGLAQTVRVVCPPEKVGYVYIGADLSISALLVDARTMAGDFVQCSGDRVPFRKESMDAAITLGTLHHLANDREAVRQMLAVVRGGGYLGFDEVIARGGQGARGGILTGSGSAESAHNDSVDLDALRLEIGQSADLVELRFRYSPLRAILAARLGEAMRSRPWLTRLVVGLDTLCLRTLGRVMPSTFGPREVLMLSRKRGGQRAGAARALSPQ